MAGLARILFPPLGRGALPTLMAGLLLAATLLRPWPAHAAAPAASREVAGATADAWRDPATGIEFRRIPGGEFTMGSDAFPNEQPVHRVRVSEFWLATSEVTRAQWRALMGSVPSPRSPCEECPVAQVSWLDAQEFLRRGGFRLPTEAEWEYAAGGGAEHQRWAGTGDERQIGEYAWYRGNSGNRPHPVCGKRPNRFGLCDMSGNVYEWCGDWFDATYYRRSPAADPRGPASGTHRVARGGSWILDPRIAGISFRLPLEPSLRRAYLGFRPALPAAPGAGPPLPRP